MVAPEKIVGTQPLSPLSESSDDPVREEDELLDRAIRGSRPALDQLIRTHEREVYRLAYRFFHDPEEAQDAAQEVFVKVVRALPRFERRSSFKTWLYRITANTCLNLVDARKRRQKSMLDVVLDWFTRPAAEDPSSTVVERESRRELREVLAQKIARLPEAYRLPVILRDLEGMSHDQIGDILDIKEGTVKSRINRGRRLLQDSLQGYMNRGSER